MLNPQIQADGLPYRTEPGAGAEAYQGFINQTSRIEWGLTPHQPGENGGISGIVSYDTTRAEDDPAYNGQEEWQPGVPRVQMVLYADDPLHPGVILGSGTGGATCFADVDNWPFGWAKGTAPRGPEDLKRNTCAGWCGAKTMASGLYSRGPPQCVQRRASSPCPSQRPGWERLSTTACEPRRGRIRDSM